MERMLGKTVLITGAASGIGRAAALIFAREGADLILADQNESGLFQSETDASEYHTKVISIPTDVTQSQQCERLVREGVNYTKALHVVLNCAGIGVFDKTVEHASEAEWDHVMNINLKSVFLVSKFAIPHLRQCGGGSIINFASPHAFLTGVGVAPYAASKGGVLALSRQMAFDLADDYIRVNAVIPGAVDTPMLRSHAERQDTSLEALGFYDDPKKLGRIAQPEEFAKALIWLASEESSFVNASPVFIDYGLTARL